MPTDRADRYEHGQRWRRFEQMTSALIASLRATGDEPGLLSIAAWLSDGADRLSAADAVATDNSDEKFTQSHAATLVDLRAEVYSALIELAENSDAAEERLDTFLPVLRDKPLFYSTMLDAAEVFAAHDRADVAARLIQDSPYSRALTVSSLGHDSERDVLAHHFRYWRLRYLLAARFDDVPEPVPPSADTPAGDSISPTAPVHSDSDAIELAARIDRAVRELARIEARALSDTPTFFADDWAKIVALLDVIPPSHSSRRSATFEGIAAKRRGLLGLIVGVALHYGDGMPEKLAAVIESRINEEPARWPTAIQLDLADALRAEGVHAPWYASATAVERVRASEQDVYSRLEDVAALARRYSRDGDTDAARALTLSLIPLAFGVGYRKDYQFDTWVAWLGRALAEDGDLVDDAIWLARVLTAADPMTEGVPGSAAADLPAVVAPVAPIAAVRLFEYLVRHGTIHHLDSLSAVVQALVNSLPASPSRGLDLAADLAAELVAPAANRAYSDLAQSVVSAIELRRGRVDAEESARSMAERCERYALPTTRRSWLIALGLPLPAEPPKYDSDSSETNYGALVLTDGRRIQMGAKWERKFLNRRHGSGEKGLRYRCGRGISGEKDSLDWPGPPESSTVVDAELSFFFRPTDLTVMVGDETLNRAASHRRSLTGTVLLRL